MEIKVEHNKWLEEQNINRTARFIGKNTLVEIYRTRIVDSMADNINY